MGPALANTGEVGRRCKYIGAFLHSVSPGDSDILVLDMVHDPPHGADPGGVPQPGSEMAHVKTPQARSRQDLEIPSIDEGHMGIWA